IRSFILDIGATLATWGTQVGVPGWLQGVYQMVLGVPAIALIVALIILAVAIPLSAWSLVRLVRTPTGNVTYADGTPEDGHPPRRAPRLSRPAARRLRPGAPGPGTAGPVFRCTGPAAAGGTRPARGGAASERRDHRRSHGRGRRVGR